MSLKRFLYIRSEYFFTRGKNESPALVLEKQTGLEICFCRIIHKRPSPAIDPVLTKDKTLKIVLHPVVLINRQRAIEDLRPVFLRQRHFSAGRFLTLISSKVVTVRDSACLI